MLLYTACGCVSPICRRLPFLLAVDRPRMFMQMLVSARRYIIYRTAVTFISCFKTGCMQKYTLKMHLCADIAQGVIFIRLQMSINLFPHQICYQPVSKYHPDANGWFCKVVFEPTISLKSAGKNKL